MKFLDLFNSKFEQNLHEGAVDNKPVDSALQRLKVKARHEHPNAESDDEALALHILDKEQGDVKRLDRVNDREDRMIDRLLDLEQKLQQRIDGLEDRVQAGGLEEHGGGIGPRQHWQSMKEVNGSKLTAKQRWAAAADKREKYHRDIEARRQAAASQGREDMSGAISRLEKMLSQRDDDVKENFSSPYYHVVDTNKKSVKVFVDSQSAVKFLNSARSKNPEAVKWKIITKKSSAMNEQGVAEGAVKDLYTDLAKKYRELAPSIEKYKDSFLAGQLYDALEAIAVEHGAEKEFQRMMTGARNRAHMDYDTNPGGFQNWFWYLPFADEQLDEKQDACYRKVKSRYKVWPSAYASGALVQCRKKGAANWGNKSKNEDVAEGDLDTGPDGKLSAKGEEQMRQYRQQRKEQQRQQIIAKHTKTVKGQPYGVAPSRITQSSNEVDWEAANKELRKKGLAEQQLDEKCWDTHRQEGMKKKGDRMVPNCVPKESQDLEEDLRKWFKEKWVRFGPDGKIRGDCARGSESEGKPKCLPQAKAHALGKKKRASAAAKKRREDPNPERRGPAKNVATKVQEMKDTAAVEQAIMKRIMVAHRDMLMHYGPEKIIDVAGDVAYNVGDIGAAGEDDINSWVHQVRQLLGDQ